MDIVCSGKCDMKLWNKKKFRYDLPAYAGPFRTLLARINFRRCLTTQKNNIVTLNAMRTSDLEDIPFLS
jgi:hypothetical protein